MKRIIYFVILSNDGRISQTQEAKFEFDYITSKLFDDNLLPLAAAMDEWLKQKLINSQLIKRTDNGEILRVKAIDGEGYCLIANSRRKLKYLLSLYDSGEIKL